MATPRACKRPKCYRTKKNKCTVPNPWIMFLQQNKGSNLTRDELSAAYKQWKTDVQYDELNTVSQRRFFNCSRVLKDAGPTEQQAKAMIRRNVATFSNSPYEPAQDSLANLDADLPIREQQISAFTNSGWLKQDSMEHILKSFIQLMKPHRKWGAKLRNMAACFDTKVDKDGKPVYWKEKARDRKREIIYFTNSKDDKELSKGSHWYIAVVDPKANRVEYTVYDSIDGFKHGDDHKRFLDQLKIYFPTHADKPWRSIAREWDRQKDGNSCGYFVLAAGINTIAQWDFEVNQLSVTKMRKSLRDYLVAARTWRSSPTETHRKAAIQIMHNALKP